MRTRVRKREIKDERTICNVKIHFMGLLMAVFKSTSAVKCLRIVWNGLSVQKNMQDITLINPKQAQDFVHRKLQLLNTWGTVAPRSSIRFFFRRAVTGLKISTFAGFVVLLFMTVCTFIISFKKLSHPQYPKEETDYQIFLKKLSCRRLY